MALFPRLTDTGLTEEQRARVREELIRGYLPLADHIARRFRDRGQPEDDLRQVAAVGLVKAVDRFDVGYGTDFLAFAVPSITGEVKRYFRDMTWAVHVPRRLQELSRNVRAASEELAQELGHAPRPSELATHLGIPVSDVVEALQAGYAHDSDSTDRSDDMGVSLVDDIRSSDADEDSIADRMALYPALARLPRRQAMVVVLRFSRDMTQSHIARHLGISQMHVSRLLSAALRTLREVLGDGEFEAMVEPTASRVPSQRQPVPAATR